LRELSSNLVCADCTIADAGLAALAAHLPVGLEGLELNAMSFMGCPRYTDAGLVAIAARLPQLLQLRRLDLRFQHGKMSSSGLAFFATKLPTELKSLHITMHTARQVNDTGVAALARHLPTGLEQLSGDVAISCASDAATGALNAGLAA